MVMDGAANSPGANGGFTFDDEEPEAVADRTLFRPGILGLGGAGEESGFAGGKKKRFTLVGRGTGFCIGAGLISEEVVEVDPWVLYMTHGDRRPFGFCATEQGGLVFFEIIVDLFPQ